MRSHRFGCPDWHHAHSGSMPRVAHVQDRDQHDPRTVVEIADHLVAGRERERHDGLEVARRVPVDGGEVDAADARQPRSHRTQPSRPT